MKNTAAVLPEPDLRRCDKSCSRCGAIRKRPLFKATKWKCEKCKTIHDRKSNSKANIDTFYRNAIAIHYGWIPFGPQAVHNPQLRAAILYFCDEVFRKLVEGLELAVPRPPLGGPVPFIFPSHPPGRVEQILHEPRRNTLDTLPARFAGWRLAVIGDGVTGCEKRFAANPGVALGFPPVRTGGKAQGPRVRHPKITAVPTRAPGTEHGSQTSHLVRMTHNPEATARPRRHPA